MAGNGVDAMWFKPSAGSNYDSLKVAKYLVI